MMMVVTFVTDFCFSLRGELYVVWNESRGVKSGDHGLSSSGGRDCDWYCFCCLLVSHRVFFSPTVLFFMTFHGAIFQTHSLYGPSDGGRVTRKSDIPTASIDFISQTIAPPRNIF
jgi:hypothetical protein